MNDRANTPPIKRFFVDILMGGIFLLLLGFVLWLIWITYFREYFDTGVYQPREQTAMEKVTSAMNAREHFHNIDETVLIPTKSTSLCFTCHGNYPHSKAKEIRAFRNAHTFFMACEVCHLQEEKRGHVSFKWLDNDTGQEVEKFHGKAGIYGAKIIPMEIINDTESRLDEVGDKAFAQQYLDQRVTFNADQEAAAKIRLHKDIAEKPVFCDGCHTNEEDVYLPFSDLGYSQQRLDELTGTDVVGMLNKYEEFHMPKLIRGGGQQDKEEPKGSSEF